MSLLHLTSTFILSILWLSWHIKVRTEWCNWTELTWFSFWHCPLSSNRQHYGTDDCLEDNREDKNCHYHYICTVIIGSYYNFRFRSFFCVLCFLKVKLSVKVKLFVLLLCVCAILPAKAIPEMTYTVSGGT